MEETIVNNVAEGLPFRNEPHDTISQARASVFREENNQATDLYISREPHDTAPTLEEVQDFLRHGIPTTMRMSEIEGFLSGFAVAACLNLNLTLFVKVKGLTFTEEFLDEFLEGMHRSDCFPVPDDGIGQSDTSGEDNTGIEGASTAVDHAMDDLEDNCRQDQPGPPIPADSQHPQNALDTPPRDGTDDDNHVSPSELRNGLWQEYCPTSTPANGCEVFEAPLSQYEAEVLATEDMVLGANHCFMFTEVSLLRLPMTLANGKKGWKLHVDFVNDDHAPYDCVRREFATVWKAVLEWLANVREGAPEPLDEYCKRMGKRLDHKIKYCIEKEAGHLSYYDQNPPRA